jgi:23S rRNA pseudouridine1911/1915/1917 synthase
MKPDLVIAEQGELVFLRKDAGLPVFPPHRDPSGACLLASWVQARPEQAGIPWPEGFAGGIAHRLDVSSSGIVVACTSLDALASLRAQFAAGVLRKSYRFVTQRCVAWREHLVELPIAHDRSRRSRMVVQRGRSTPHRGRWFPAHTELSRLSAGCWRAVITTGVTHQIRVHAAFVGLALAGDRLYGGGELPAGLQAPVGASFLLHHESIVGPGWSSPRLGPPGWWGPYGSSA